MNGMNRMDGTALAGVDHLNQSIADILMTPIGSRVMRREYGSDLFKLVDQPISDELVLDTTAAAATALARWEPRMKIERIYVSMVNAGGSLEISIDGIYLPDGTARKIEGIEI